MTTRLAPMRAEAFDAFVEEVVSHYAHDNVIAGRWSVEDALACARSDLKRLLPQGLATPKHQLFDIIDEATQGVIGTLWFAVVEADSSRHGYVYTLRIQPAFRGQGHARAALERIEAVALDAGLSSIALHVFGFNTSAQALYRSAGYGITGLNMRKRLGSSDSP